MQEFLSKLVGRRIDLFCIGGYSLRGEIVKLDSGVLHLKEEERVCFVAVDKIVIVWEAKDDDRKAGFLSTGINERLPGAESE